MEFKEILSLSLKCEKRLEQLKTLPQKVVEIRDRIFQKCITDITPKIH